jgi:signal transduction histidine kinase
VARRALLGRLAARVSTRLRVALVSSLLAAVVLTVLGWLYYGQLQAHVYDEARQKAEARAEALAEMLRVVDGPDFLPANGYPYEVVDGRDGSYVSSCPEYNHPGGGRFLAPTPRELDNRALIENRTVTVSIDRPRGADARLWPVCSQLWGRTVDLCVVGRPAGERYIVYATSELDSPLSPSGQGLLGSTRTELFIGIPVAVLLVGAMAWFAVRGALRPVDAIRAKVAEINTTDLDRRVPVPATGDEVGALAVTMNEMLDRVEQSVARQQAFIADASHELRTPLASMRNQLEVLATYPDRIDSRTTCANVVLDIERMEELVTGLLLLTRLGHQDPAAERVDLAELVAGCVAERPRLDTVAITVDAPEPVRVHGDGTRLEQVVRNLLDNAERHATSRVSVSVHTVRGKAELVVADDGPGIPVSDRERVFERFVRLDEGRSRDAGGAGLGLAIVADVARAHDGEVEVLTGTGAVFVVRLPLPDTQS